MSESRAIPMATEADDQERDAWLAGLKVGRRSDSAVPSRPGSPGVAVRVDHGAVANGISVRFTSANCGGAVSAWARGLYGPVTHREDDDPGLFGTLRAVLAAAGVEAT